MLYQDFEWDSCQGQVSEHRLKQLGMIMRIKLPLAFIELVKACDGGYPKRDTFKYYDVYSKKHLLNAIGCFLTLNQTDDSDFLSNYLQPPEFFPKGLIAFAENGGGDYICFDYRTDSNTSSPPIVFWRHGADVGKDISFVAENFEAFLNMLKEPEDEDLAGGS